MDGLRLINNHPEKESFTGIGDAKLSDHEVPASPSPVEAGAKDSERETTTTS